MKNPEILFLGGIFDSSINEDIITNSRGAIQYAADALQKSLIEGLGIQLDRFEILNIPFLGSYPKRYKKLFSPCSSSWYTTMGKKIPINTYRYLNIPLLKQYDIARVIIKKYRRLYGSNQNPRIIIIYALFFPFLKAAYTIKKEFKNVKIIQIVPDLPEFMSSRRNIILRMLKSYSIHQIHKLTNKVDGFVLLSQHMIERLPIKNKPWVVVEGIYNSSLFSNDKSYNSDKIRQLGDYILYTGTLSRRYGIINLVKAFLNTSQEKFNLVICGYGDTVNEIIDYSKIDSRIIYLGQVNRETALNLQKEATLLVNPRTTEGEYTKYSFPSKTMEYLGSGIPVLMYELPGIPKEYYNFFYSPNDESIESLTKKLDELLNLPPEELKSFGKKAQEFVVSEKNPIKQTSKIINLINRL